jgi:uncharacterized protein YutE (UPF0331/DUF86 family)
VANKSQLPAVVPLCAKPTSLAYVNKPLSQRWRVDAECKRLGWVMVPHTAGENITSAVAAGFDRLQASLYQHGLYEIAHPHLLSNVERLEEKLVEQLCDLAKGWLSARLNGWQKARTVIVTNQVAVQTVSDLVSSLFVSLGTKISDYKLINDKDDQEALILLNLENLQEDVTEGIVKIVRGWK